MWELQGGTAAAWKAWNASGLPVDLALQLAARATPSQTCLAIAEAAATAPAFGDRQRLLCARELYFGCDDERDPSEKEFIFACVGPWTLYHRAPMVGAFTRG